MQTIDLDDIRLDGAAPVPSVFEQRDATPETPDIDLRDVEALKAVLPGRFVPIDDPLVLGIQVLPEHLPLDDRPKLGVPYLSPSQFTTYKRCSASYWLKYGMGLKEKQTSALVFGSANHAGWHAHLDAIRYRTGDPQQAALEAIFGYLKGNPIDAWSPSYSKGPPDTQDSFVEAVLRGYEMLVPRIEQINPVALEAGYLLLWRDGVTFPIVGYGDAIEDLGDGTHGVVDYKTAGKAKTEAELDYNFATKLYAGCHERAWGVPTRKRRFLGVARNKEPKMFELELTSPEPFSFDRLYANARALMVAREAGVYLATEDAQICPGCSLAPDCTKTFGPR